MGGRQGRKADSNVKHSPKTERLIRLSLKIFQKAAGMERKGREGRERRQERLIGLSVKFPRVGRHGREGEERGGKVGEGKGKKGKNTIQRFIDNTTTERSKMAMKTEPQTL
jgi:hypothetical protein